MLQSSAALPDKTWDTARKILCIRLDSMGDVLMTTPALRALKSAVPGRTLTLLTSQAGENISRLIPEIDQTITYDAPWIKATAPRPNSKAEVRMIKQLRRGKYDGAVIFTVFSQNPLPAAFMTYLADIPLRLAYSRENPYQILTHWLPDPYPCDDSTIPHEVSRLLDLVAAINCETDDKSLSLQVPTGAQQRVLKILQVKGIDLNQPWLVIHPGASASSRRYQPDGFAAAAQSLALDHGFQIIFTGISSEEVLITAIQAAMSASSVSLAGELSLGEMVGLLQLSPLLISNNTGPVHIAAALGTPVVDLYALTNPQHTPWGVPHRILNHDVPCKYCYKSVCPMGHHNCLRLVEPALIVEAALDLIKDSIKKPEISLSI